MEIREYTQYDEADVLRLYAAVGWTAYTDNPEALRKGGELIGICRAVGDGETIVFVQDLLVLPAYRRQGVGSALLRAVLAHYAHVRQIELAADDTAQTAAFYRSAGFRELSELGCRGYMWICVRRNTE